MKALMDGTRLRTLREARGWDKQTLAEQAGVSASVLTRLERGSQADLRVSVLLALARALEVEPSRLLTADTPALEQALPELQAAVHEASKLSLPRQRHLASLIRTYILDMPQD